MRREARTGLSKYFLGACVALVTTAGISSASDKEAELRALIEQQSKQIEALKERLDALTPTGLASQEVQPKPDPEKKPVQGDPPPVDRKTVQDIAAEYLRANPGAGLPPSVQTGFFSGSGFVIRSAPNPPYVRWEDECRIPFELRIRGRAQLAWYNYQTRDNFNHLTDQPLTPAQHAGFNQLEVKRLRLIWQGHVFDPNLRYHFELDGNTRGLGGTQANRAVQTSGANPQGNVSPIGGGVDVDHAVRLFSAFVAYDFRGCAAEKGCGPDCPPGQPKYAPTYSLIMGKLKPLFGLEEYLGSGNEQFVEFSMANWMFDADDDNLQMAAGTQIRAFDDRFYVQALLTNGNESQFPNTRMDDYFGYNVGFWWDFGGTWNPERERWDLFGDSLSDVDYACNPVLRVGSAVNLVPLNRRFFFGDLEQSRVFVMPAGPGGTRLINLFNGDGSAGRNAVDKFNSFSYNVFAAGKYKGFSLYNEWWFRNLEDFHSAPAGNDRIIYTFQDPRLGPVNALFPNRTLFDYGMTLQAGYFLVPKKLEIVGRWSWVRGESGDIKGDGTFRTLPAGTVPGVANVRVFRDAFTHHDTAYEYAIGVNYFFKRQQLKWQSDLSFYEGGNPAGGGASPAGFIPGVDGWLLRSQLQLAF